MEVTNHLLAEYKPYFMNLNQCLTPILGPRACDLSYLPISIQLVKQSLGLWKTLEQKFKNKIIIITFCIVFKLSKMLLHVYLGIKFK